jgi:plastocyanin
MRRRTAQLALVVVPLVLIAAAPAAIAADQSVTATPSNRFSPETVTVTQGESVTWTNAGGYHNVHFDDESFLQPPIVDQSAWTVSRTFGEPGSFTYYCDAHSFVGMTGAVNVVAPDPGADPSATGTAAGGAPVSGQAATPVCTSQRRFTIRLRGLEKVRVRSVRVDFNGKQLPVATQAIDGRRRHTALIDMRGLPRGTYSVAITVTSKDGAVLRGSRTYRTCAAKLQSSALPRL